MFGNSLYYQLKPYLPWGFRMALRRMLARRIRKTCQGVWPINETTAQPPEGWPGWPDGKQFAFVLTHDVEGRGGLAKCRQLMQLEQEMGFRSSFNFVPEGNYAVSRELREELVQNGFEVGVQDLHHDGKLYQSRREFAENAIWINHYLKEWGAKGFRSGFMLHNLEWLHDLDVAYDASTFDTDPFEPQPDGAGTIFPFWVARLEGQKSEARSQNSELPSSLLRPRSSGLGPSSVLRPPRSDPSSAFRLPPSGGGYVELPYTLVQDSTLFLSLRETSPEIWLKKLDWVVQHGGMALVNVHPDYLRFPGEPASPRTYPVAHYVQLLEHLKQRYAGAYWNVLPYQVAGWFKEQCLPKRPSRAVGVSASIQRPLEGKRAAVVLYSYYASDPRPRRETEALQQAGMEVDVICLREHSAERRREQINDVNVFRLPLKRRRAGKVIYVFQYLWFLAGSFFTLFAWSLKRRYHLVHVHNMPDFLVFSALVPKWRGARIILDLHDPMPELMVTIFGLREDSAVVRLLKFLERASIRFADQVLTVNLACKNIFTARGCPPEKIQVLMNTPDERIFQFRSDDSSAKVKPARPFVIMYHGSIVERNGLDLAVEALQICREAVHGAELRIYGAATPFLETVLESARRSGLNGAVRYLGRKPQKEIAAEIQNCDIGVIPNRNSAFTEINTPTRIFEYLSLGKPVITPRARGITDYFGAEDLVFFELGNARDLARQLEYVHAHPDAVQATVRRGQTVYLEHCWSHERECFLNGVGALLEGRRLV